MKASDPYKTLGLRRDATDAEVKRAYRELAFKNHPDRGGDEEFFKLLSQAMSRITEQRAIAVRDFGTATHTHEDHSASTRVTNASRHHTTWERVRQHKDIGRPTGIDEEDYDRPKDARASAAKPNIGRPTRRR